MLKWLTRQTDLFGVKLRQITEYSRENALAIFLPEIYELCTKRAKRGHYQAMYEFPVWVIKYRDGELLEQIKDILFQQNLRAMSEVVNNKLVLYINWD